MHCFMAACLRISFWVMWILQQGGPSLSSFYLWISLVDMHFWPMSGSHSYTLWISIFFPQDFISFLEFYFLHSLDFPILCFPSLSNMVASCKNALPCLISTHWPSLPNTSVGSHCFVFYNRQCHISQILYPHNSLQSHWLLKLPIQVIDQSKLSVFILKLNTSSFRLCPKWFEEHF